MARKVLVCWVLLLAAATGQTNAKIIVLTWPPFGPVVFTGAGNRQVVTQKNDDDEFVATIAEPGRYTVSIDLDGYGPESQTVDVELGKTYSLSFSLKPLPGHKPPPPMPSKGLPSPYPSNGLIPTEKGFRLEAGYEFADPTDPNSLEVRPKVGLVRSDKGFQAAPGYEWVDPKDPKNLDVRLKRGLTRTADGMRPASGYDWVDPNDPSNLTVRLKPGLIDLGGATSSLRPAPGYRWVDPSDPTNFEVVADSTPNADGVGETQRTTQRVELGWMNITPCSKTDWVESSIPGIAAPRLTTAEQRLTAYADVDIGSTVRSILENTIKECALVGVAACGLSSVISSPAACYPVFQPAFTACVAAKLGDVTLNDLKLSVESKCMW